MDTLAQLFSALASLAWPVVFAVLLFKLYGPIRKLVESASGRKFTLKVAGNELSMEEASEQQRKSIDDLQFKLAELERLLAGGPAASLQPAPQMPPVGRGAPAAGGPVHSPAPVPAAAAVPAASTQRILWVDDNPKNNSVLIASLQERGVRVDTALSTDEALTRLGQQPYDVVISDMQRPEGAKAGLDLTRQMQARALQMPVYIFCGPGAARGLRDEALAAGVAEITSSGTSLLSALPLALIR